MKKLINLSSALLLVVGTIFKLEHWPGANILMILGSLSMIIGILFVGYKENEDNEMKSIQNVVFTLGFVTLILGRTFKFMHWPNADALTLVSIIILLIIIMLSIVDTDLMKKFSTQFLYTAILIACITFSYEHFKQKEPEHCKNDHQCENCSDHQDSSKNHQIDTTKK